MPVHPEHLARLEEQRVAAQAAEARRLEGLLGAAVAVLVEGFGARRVILFGSLARGDLSGHLDVDLAVEGIAPERHWEAAGAAAQVLGAEVDLVALEDPEPRLGAIIHQEGRLLHG